MFATPVDAQCRCQGVDIGRGSMEFKFSTRNTLGVVQNAGCWWCVFKRSWIGLTPSLSRECNARLFTCQLLCLQGSKYLNRVWNYARNFEVPARVQTVGWFILLLLWSERATSFQHKLGIKFNSCQAHPTHLNIINTPTLHL